MSEAPTVTVLIPARNEEADIERCLRAVLAQDYPHDRMEIVLVDGGSTDRTAEVASGVLGIGDVEWRIVDNPTGTTPSNLNVGLAVATGKMLCRVDARSVVPPEYVRTCTTVLRTRSDVIVTGGAQVATARADASLLGRAIARALNNRFAMGGSRYRSGATAGPTDTVYLGAFRTDELRSAGGWSEFFATNQDFELNRRLGRHGTVWFHDGIDVAYLPRMSLSSLVQQYFRFGRWKVRYWRHTNDPPRPRQLVPLVGVSAAAAAMVAAARRPRTLGAFIAGGAIGLIGLDHVGAAGPAGSEERVLSALALGGVLIAWPAGVLVELAIGERP